MLTDARPQKACRTLPAKQAITIVSYQITTSNETENSQFTTVSIADNVIHHTIIISSYCHFWKDNTFSEWLDLMTVSTSIQIPNVFCVHGCVIQELRNLFIHTPKKPLVLLFRPRRHTNANHELGSYLIENGHQKFSHYLKMWDAYSNHGWLPRHGSKIIVENAQPNDVKCKIRILRFHLDFNLRFAFLLNSV